MNEKIFPIKRHTLMTNIISYFKHKDSEYNGSHIHIYSYCPKRAKINSIIIHIPLDMSLNLLSIYPYLEKECNVSED